VSEAEGDLPRDYRAAVAALGIMGVYAIGLVFFGAAWQPFGWLGAALSLVTVFTTSMIYTQLRTVPRWHHWSTPVLFLAFALAGGALLSGRVTAALVLILLSGGLQLWWWQDGDKRLARSGTDLGTATGLGGIGTVRSFEPPHTGGNYLTREMVFVVARKHARKLRLIALFLVMVLPVALLALPFAHGLGALAVLSFAAGMALTRWLFFAEAEHVVGLYYGAR
jgi:DMSO reductase anchor subunit